MEQDAPELDSVHVGLRAQDVHQGLIDSPIDRNSGILATELEATQLTGMAASLAAWVKGQNVVADAQQLRVVSSQQLDISPFVFDRVVTLLEERGFVWNVVRRGDRIVSFNESVPGSYDEVFGDLGRAWADRKPTEIEHGLLSVVQTLSAGPRPVADLGMERDTSDEVLEVGRLSESIRTVQLQGELIAYTPFLAYEHPESIAAALEQLDLDEIHDSLASLRAYQGAPMSKSQFGTTLTALAGAGLVAAPTLERPDHSRESFAVAPFGVAPEFRGIAKPVLDKALAIVTAVRMGEHFGGRTSLWSPTALLRKLLSGVATAAHSSTERQYSVLHNLGVIRFERSSAFTAIRLIPTDDNRRAVEIAIDLLQHGEATQSRLFSPSNSGSLLAAGRFRSPIQATRVAREKVDLDERTLREAIEAAMGRQPID